MLSCEINLIEGPAETIHRVRFIIHDAKTYTLSARSTRILNRYLSSAAHAMFSESIWAFTIVCNISHQCRLGLTLHGTHRSVAYPDRRLLRCTKSPVVHRSREIPCWPRSSKPMSNRFREHYMDPAGHFHRMQYIAVVTRP